MTELDFVWVSSRVYLVNQELGIVKILGEVEQAEDRWVVRNRRHWPVSILL